jgi:hypothetical protein
VRAQRRCIGLRLQHSKGEFNLPRIFDTGGKEWPSRGLSDRVVTSPTTPTGPNCTAGTVAASC